LKKGTILYHESFEFKNGEIGEKLLVLLNTPKPSVEPHLLCKATSQQDGKPQIPGCHPSLSLFFISAGQDFFVKDTWLQLYDIYPVDTASVLQDSFNKQLIIKGILSDKTIIDLMSCIGKIKDIEIEYKRLILEKNELIDKLLEGGRFRAKKR